MNDLEIACLSLFTEFQRKNTYKTEQYQMLHGVKYQKTMASNWGEQFRAKFQNNCYGAAMELKTYYAENGIPSTTVVLKMRPTSPEIQEIVNLQVYSEIEKKDIVYTHHAIEIFKEHGRFKILDILHSDKVEWLETYLDKICAWNHCTRDRLRYDMGYLAPCHAFATNMDVMAEIMRYLDKIYCIGKPRLNLIDVCDSGMYLSDDIAMNFTEFGKLYSCNAEEVMRTFASVHDKVMGIQMTQLFMRGLGQIVGDPFITDSMANSIFDNATLCKLIDTKKV